MDFNFIVTQLISGFTMATLLFLVASGLTLIFGVGNIFNFAHGSFYMIGAYFGYQLVSVWKVNFWIALVSGRRRCRPGRCGRRIPLSAPHLRPCAGRGVPDPADLRLDPDFR